MVCSLPKLQLNLHPTHLTASQLLHLINRPRQLTRLNELRRSCRWQRWLKEAQKLLGQPTQLQVVQCHTTMEHILEVHSLVRLHQATSHQAVQHPSLLAVYPRLVSQTARCVVCNGHLLAARRCKVKHESPLSTGKLQSKGTNSYSASRPGALGPERCATPRHGPRVRPSENPAAA